MIPPGQELDDMSPMPFGKFKAKPMTKVPAEWLHWYWTQPGKKEDMVCPVCDYIRRSLRALKKEAPDLIWT